MAHKIVLSVGIKQQIDLSPATFEVLKCNFRVILQYYYVFEKQLFKNYFKFFSTFFQSRCNKMPPTWSYNQTAR